MCNNHNFKQWISLEIMLLWLWKVIMSLFQFQGFNLKKTIFFARRRHHLKNSWKIFQIQITPLLWRPQGPQGCLEKQNYPLSSNLAVCCAKIGLKTRKLQKTVEKPSFLTLFQSFLVLNPILAHQTTKFKISGQFCFSRHPCGRQSSGVICI